MWSFSFLCLLIARDSNKLSVLCVSYLCLWNSWRLYHWVYVSCVHYQPSSTEAQNETQTSGPLSNTPTLKLRKQDVVPISEKSVTLNPQWRTLNLPSWNTYSINVCEEPSLCQGPCYQLKGQDQEKAGSSVLTLTFAGNFLALSKSFIFLSFSFLLCKLKVG